MITTYSKLRIPETRDEPGLYLKPLPSTLEVIDEVFSLPKLLPPHVALTELQSDACQWNYFQLGFLRKGQCLPVHHLLTVSLLALRPVDTTQPEGRGSGMLRSFKLYPQSPHANTTPFFCEGAGLAMVMTDVSIAMNSYFHFRGKGPKL